MNYSVIQAAREKLERYENELAALKKRVNISVFSLIRTNLKPAEKKKIWESFSKWAKNIAEEAEKTVSKLNIVQFAEEEDILNEDRDSIIKGYNSLLNELQRERETIIRQIEKDVVPITPLQRKIPKEGYCYFCDRKISSEVPYRLTKEEQGVLEIEIAKGAGFCSQECLLGHCKEYKNREKIRQEEEKKNEEKIESGKRLVTQIQLTIGDLLNGINRLKRKQEELETKIDAGIFPAEEKVGFFRRIAQSLGLAKKADAYAKLAEIKRKKARLERDLEKKNEELQKTLVMLSVDEQVQKERQTQKKKLLHDKKLVIQTKKTDDVSDD